MQSWGVGYSQQFEQDWDSKLQVDLASSTQRAYGSHQRQYQEFCERMRRPVRPDPHTLAQFVIGRAEHGYALSTIEQDVYAVARWGADRGVSGLAADPEVQRALKVAAKKAVPQGQQKLPLDRRDLREILFSLAVMGDEDYVGVRDQALFLLGWAGMFRSSELVGIQWRDVVFASSGGVMVYIPQSKTDQAGQGAWVFVAECAQEPICALCWHCAGCRGFMRSAGQWVAQTLSSVGDRRNCARWLKPQ